MNDFTLKHQVYLKTFTFDTFFPINRTWTEKHCLLHCRVNLEHKPFCFIKI